MATAAAMGTLGTMPALAVMAAVEAWSRPLQLRHRPNQDGRYIHSMADANSTILQVFKQ